MFKLGVSVGTGNSQTPEIGSAFATQFKAVKNEPGCYWRKCWSEPPILIKLTEDIRTVNFDQSNLKWLLIQQVLTTSFRIHCLENE